MNNNYTFDTTRFNTFMSSLMWFPTDAAYTYYRTLNQKASLERRGKAIERKQASRRRERNFRVSDLVVHWAVGLLDYIQVVIGIGSRLFTGNWLK